MFHCLERLRLIGFALKYSWIVLVDFDYRSWAQGGHSIMLEGRRQRRSWGGGGGMMVGEGRVDRL